MALPVLLTLLPLVAAAALLGPLGSGAPASHGRRLGRGGAAHVPPLPELGADFTQFASWAADNGARRGRASAANVTAGLERALRRARAIRAALRSRRFDVVLAAARSLPGAVRSSLPASVAAAMGGDEWVSTAANVTTVMGLPAGPWVKGHVAVVAHAVWLPGGGQDGSGGGGAQRYPLVLPTPPSGHTGHHHAILTGVGRPVQGVLVGGTFVSDHDGAGVDCEDEPVPAGAPDDGGGPQPLAYRCVVAGAAVLTADPDALAADVAAQAAVALGRAAAPGRGTHDVVGHGRGPGAQRALLPAAQASGRLRSVHLIAVRFTDQTAATAATVEMARTICNAAAGNLSASSFGRMTLACSVFPTVVALSLRSSQMAGCDSCEDTVMDEARAASGNAGSAQHVVVVMSGVSNLGWAGLGTMPGNNVWVNVRDNLADSTHTLKHELGHNVRVLT